MATWSPRTFSFEQILAAAHLNEIRDFLNRVAPAKVTAVGDLVVGSEAHNVSRLAVGSDNQVLVADSSESLGMRWGTVGGACRIVRDTSVFTIANSTLTDMEYETEEFDTHGFADLSSDNTRITIPSGMAGIYVVRSGMDWQTTSSSGTRQMRLYHYDSSDVMLHNIILVVPTDDKRRQIVDIWPFSAGDYIKVQMSQNSGGSLGVMYGDIVSLSVAMVYKL